MTTDELQAELAAIPPRMIAELRRLSRLKTEAEEMFSDELAAALHAFAVSGLQLLIAAERQRQGIRV